VQRTFKDKLNIQIPRTTALQSEFGEEVSIEDLKMGDLVFFKTGFKVRHVGIYLEGGKFLHASTKRGVTISRLDNPYYEKHFWKVIRVLD
jgi:cell wall-associated NlpC family hydrolase